MAEEKIKQNSNVEFCNCKNECISTRRQANLCKMFVVLHFQNEFFTIIMINLIFEHFIHEI